MMMNSSVRGPFLPAYWPRDVPWTRILTDRLSNTVKLVGPTISCEGAAAVAAQLQARSLISVSSGKLEVFRTSTDFTLGYISLRTCTFSLLALDYGTETRLQYSSGY